MTEALATPDRGRAQGEAAREAAWKAKSKDNTSLNGSGMWGWCWREEYGSSQRPDFGRIEGREAAVEFHKILDHCGIAMNEPIGAPNHLQLGSAHPMQSESRVGNNLVRGLHVA